MDWFTEHFGFEEASCEHFENVRQHFLVQHDGKDDCSLRSIRNDRTFSIGLFSTPSVSTLRTMPSPHHTDDDQGLVFKNLVADARDLHRIPGAVIQAASQFNCLEMPSPGTMPEHGITGYIYDRTQGPVCAMACPAGTVYRNYFWNGVGQAGGSEHQLNTLDQVEKLLDNSKHNYWQMQNGYLMPSTRESMAKVSKVLEDGELREKVRDAVKVGVQWNTEVSTDLRVCKDEPHHVTQVYSSAVPVAYDRKTSKENWRPFATTVLEATYEATLAVAALLAARRNKRIPTYLTCVGGGVFGNPTGWIRPALQRALTLYKDAPLDVFLVHYGSVQHGYDDLPGLFRGHLEGKAAEGGGGRGDGSET